MCNPSWGLTWPGLTSCLWGRLVDLNPGCGMIHYSSVTCDRLEVVLSFANSSVVGLPSLGTPREQ